MENLIKKQPKTKIISQSNYDIYISALLSLSDNLNYLSELSISYASWYINYIFEDHLTNHFYKIGSTILKCYPKNQ